MRNLILITTFLFSFSSLFSTITQPVDPSSQKSIFDVISQQEVVEVNLEMNLDQMLSDRKSEESFDAEFSFKDHNDQLQNWKVKVNIRGKYRRLKCKEMPPLKVNFKKKDLANSGLAPFDDFKLVTQCVQDKALAKELLLKEYLAYKIYNKITDYSFRVQFLKIKFKDAISGRVKTQWGFIIEDTGQLRARLKAEKYEGIFGIKVEETNKEQFKSMALFQYMIGNLDWDLHKRAHNVKVIKKEGKLLAIPYDFDFSGLVSAPYATFNPSYNVKSRKDRFYLGNPEDLEEMNETVELFKSKKEKIIQLVKGFKLLKREDRRETIDYLNLFYKDIEKIQLPESRPLEVKGTELSDG